jgi:predicted nucleic acid-binding protein
MKVALDTNVLAYVEGVNGEARQQSAIALLRALARGATLVPVQALGELFNVLVRKSGWARDRARTAILTWRDAFPLAPTTEASIISAADLSADHGLAIWDSIMVAVAAEGGCRLLLSEDLQDGFSWRGVTVVNPFAASRHPLLDALMGDADPSGP